jgi:flagellar hook-basal body protein
MSFYTSLTGLNAATAQLGVTSNNIANVGTTGFKRSRADFGDIFATSPLQKSSSTVGQGVSLKQVTQEFNQGNISFSSNALDLAITGDGFFPMRSADGLQQVYTRNGSFMLDEQFNVVNSAGQRLMAATVDSTGSANVNERVVLNIPQKTSGEAKQTSQVNLGLNFPSDASVITETFNRNNPATYNKSTALTVYDAGGNGYLATIYYVKTQNASQSSPFNKWQTYVFVGEDEVGASLQQATDSNGEQLYVNQYGQLQPYSKVKDEITTAKTQLFSLDELTDKRTSMPATVSGTAAAASYDLTNGINFSTETAFTTTNLNNLFTLDVDGSGTPVTMDLSHLKSVNATFTGTQLATEMTNVLRKKFGDESTFKLNDLASRTFAISNSRVASSVSTPVKIVLDEPTTELTVDQLVAAVQSKLNASLINTATGSESGTVTVSYDYDTQGLKFVDTATNSVLKVSSGGTVRNDVLGMPVTPITVNENGLTGTKVIPNGSSTRASSEQRFGMTVTYDSVNRTFAVKSGTTGDKSSLNLTVPSGSKAIDLLGMNSQEIKTSSTATRGTASSPAVAYGSAPTVNMSNNFAVDDTNNKFVVTVDGIKGTVVLPTDANYSLSTFITKLQNGINAMAATNGNGTPASVNGVKVSFDAIKNQFVFTSGTTGADSFIKISGSANWGLENVEAGRGSVSTWINPTQHKELVGGTLQPKYIDSAGVETTSGDGFTTLPPWSPVYLQKGQLTFDTGGKLVSPLKGTQLDTVYLAGGKGALTINVNYSGSTQYQSSFAVLSQSQDGAPEGDLVGVTIGNDGLVSASFSNGTQKSLAKILLTNFSSPSGLRQIGDSSFLASAASGEPILGNAGSAGFGTLRAGATERSNVDLTNELVDLITSQRNFQANAKAIETSSTMTSAIINLRS